MAVLIQRVIDADAAGVAFTANPTTGDRDQVIVSAVRGMGERLVSGEAMPDEWTVRGDDVECVDAPEKAVNGDAVRAVAERRARSASWACRKMSGRSRTANCGCCKRDRSRRFLNHRCWTSPRVSGRRTMSIIQRSAHRRLELGMPAMIEEFGLPFDGMYQRSFGGEAYTRIIPPGGKERTPPPWWVIGIARGCRPPCADEKAARRVLETTSWSRRWRDGPAGRPSSCPRCPRCARST